MGLFGKREKAVQPDASEHLEPGESIQATTTARDLGAERNAIVAATDRNLYILALDPEDQSRIESVLLKEGLGSVQVSRSLGLLSVTVGDGPPMNLVDAKLAKDLVEYVNSRSV